MVEPGADMDLLEKSLGAEHRGEIRAQHLEGHVAIVLQVPGEIDRGHPAGAELALDRITARESRGETGCVGHRLAVDSAKMWRSCLRRQNARQREEARRSWIG